MKKLPTSNIFLPMPVTIVGTMIKGKDNFMAAGWITRVNFKPPLLAVAVNKTHYTCEGIETNKAFSINIPGTDILKETDYAGLVSGKDVDKSHLFETFRGNIHNVPLIKGCTLCFACSLEDIIEFHTNKLYVGQIVESWSDDSYLTNGNPDLKKMDVYFLSMPDNRYWGLGSVIGKAWNRKNIKHYV